MNGIIECNSAGNDADLNHITLVPAPERNRSSEHFTNQELLAKGTPSSADCSSLRVARRVTCQSQPTCSRAPDIVTTTFRTVAPHGLSGAEIRRLSDAMRFMVLHCSKRGRLWIAHLNKGSGRAIVADVQKRINKAQTKYALPRYAVTVFETSGGLHAHVVYIGNAAIATRLKVSTKFHGIEVARVTDADGLARGYLVKERTPQAGYQREHLLGGRLKGSHRLEGGGDRVRLSRNLERDAIEAGIVEPWQHTNAKRS